MCGRIRGVRGGCRCIRPVFRELILEGGGRGEEGTDHVEGNDIFEGDLACFVLLDEDLVYFHGGGTGRQAENEGVCGRGCEGFDSVLMKCVRDGA